MKLAHEFFKLPLSFDVAKMQEEISHFSASDWHQHHEGFKGNSAIPLISVNGGINNDFKGAMLPTLARKKASYLQRFIAPFDEVCCSLYTFLSQRDCLSSCVPSRP